MTALVMDMVAPTFGVKTLKEYFRVLNENNHA